MDGYCRWQPVEEGGFSWCRRLACGFVQARRLHHEKLPVSTDLSHLGLTDIVDCGGARWWDYRRRNLQGKRSLMSTKMESLLVELLGLPASSRAMLAKQLLTSLKEDGPPELEGRWIEVIKRRVAEIDEGKVECIPAEEVFRELREELG